MSRSSRLRQRPLSNHNPLRVALAGIAACTGEVDVPERGCPASEMADTSLVADVPRHTHRHPLGRDTSPTVAP